VGTNLNLSKATHMYIDLEKTYGGDVTTPWQWGLGMRYSF
jgi:outer membrane autotransporter protein